ncbi:unnamed protein product [Notodromas monacha]|uniref:Uncharacterized protein n=1 Tax=Notodromas monacha TaxID=399045 RepID=A0A7R9GLD1_9CRUS|nr:unnamed protein product [Notodromas monacha]CAG0925587.1 unnamed protein product [Notodromas monacha]
MAHNSVKSLPPASSTAQASISSASETDDETQDKQSSAFVTFDAIFFSENRDSEPCFSHDSCSKMPAGDLAQFNCHEDEDYFADDDRILGLDDMHSVDRR